MADLLLKGLRKAYGDHFKGVKHILGAKFKGAEGHWAGHKEENEQTSHSVGKLLQAYSKHATLEMCASLN